MNASRIRFEYTVSELVDDIKKVARAVVLDVDNEGGYAYLTDEDLDDLIVNRTLELILLGDPAPKVDLDREWHSAPGR